MVVLVLWVVVRVSFKVFKSVFAFGLEVNERKVKTPAGGVKGVRFTLAVALAAKFPVQLKLTGVPLFTL